ncbi:MAG: SH3 domain-containing protein [Gallionella sp.]
MSVNICACSITDQGKFQDSDAEKKIVRTEGREHEAQPSEKNVENITTALPIRIAGHRYVIADVKLRTGPGMQYAIRQILPQGRVVVVAGATEDGWCLIVDGETPIGYVSARYLKKSGASKIHRHSSIRKSATDHRGARHTLKAPRCRPVRVYEKTTNGQVEVKELRTCQNKEGSWGR